MITLHQVPGQLDHTIALNGTHVGRIFWGHLRQRWLAVLADRIIISRGPLEDVRRQVEDHLNA